MSEKSPSIADIWNKHYATQEAFTKAMYKFRNQILDEVLKIIDKMFPACICPEDSVLKECPDELMDGAWTDVYNKELKEEIKKIQSQGTHLTEVQSYGDGLQSSKQPCPDTNTQNIHTGGAQSTGGLTGGEVKSEETYNGVNSQKPVICKPEPLCPPANNQNLKGCGRIVKIVNDYDSFVYECGAYTKHNNTIYLCEKCQGKVKDD